MADQAAGMMGHGRRGALRLADFAAHGRLPSPVGARESGASRSGRPILRIAAVGLTLLLLAWLTLPGLFVKGPHRDEPVAEAPAQEPPSWKTAALAGSLFQMDPPMFPRDVSVQTAREHGLGGREDIFTFGRVQPDAAFARLTVYRPGAEMGAEATFFLETARRAAEAGYGVLRSGVPVALDTRFGPAEIAEASFAVTGQTRTCLALRLSPEGTPLRLSGWLCGAGATTDRQQLTCLVDSLELAPQAGDAALKRAMSRKSIACGAPRTGSSRPRSS